MRAEMLAKLDELLAGLLLSRTVLGWEGESAQYVPAKERARWKALREELLAERCENCVYSAVTFESDEMGWLRCTGLSLSDAGGATLCCDPNAKLLVSRSFCCSHSTKKEPT